MNPNRKRSYLRYMKESEEYKSYQLDKLNLRFKWKKPETPEKFKEFVGAFLAETDKLGEKEALASELAKWMNSLHDQKRFITQVFKGDPEYSGLLENIEHRTKTLFDARQKELNNSFMCKSKEEAQMYKK